MATLQTLINNIDYFYEITKIPMFILNKNKIIDHYPQFFFHLPKDCFKYLINSSMTRWGKVGILSSKSDITFFIIYEEYTICFGPMLCDSLHRYKSPKEIVFFNHLIKKPSINDILKKCISFDNQKFTYIQLIYQFLFNDYLSIEDMRCILHDNKKSEAEEEVKEIIITKRDYTNKIYTYLEERKFLKYIEEGESMSARSFGINFIHSESEALSHDQLQSMKYKVVATITLMTRQVISANVPLEDAYGTSDIYIRKVDSATSSQRLNEVFMHSIIDFCALVKKNKKANYPFCIRNCIEYINQNLNKNMSLLDISNELQMNPEYISNQFKKIVGIYLRDYINKRKVEEAKFLIQCTNVSLLEISTTLSFADQSHFSKVFKKYTDISPNQYKNKLKK